MWRCLSAALLYLCLARDACEDGSCQGLNPRVVLFHKWKDLNFHFMLSSPVATCCMQPELRRSRAHGHATSQEQNQGKEDYACAEVPCFFQLECWGHLS